MTTAVRVLPDVAGIDSVFDYLLPETMSVEIGSIVRADLHGRRIRGWVVGVDVEPPTGVKLLPLIKVTGLGPTQDIIDLAHWASRRWTGHPSFYLGTASPQRAVTNLAVPPAWLDDHGSTQARRSVVVIPPARDYTDLVAEQLNGPSLVITPSRRGAIGLHRRLRARGLPVVLHPQEWARARAGGVSVVGTRAAAWMSMPQLTSVVVVDAHDEAHQSEASPTWSAIDVVTERARRAGVASTLITSVPRVTLVDGDLVNSTDQYDGWARLNVVDVRKSDPRTGRYTRDVVDLLRSDKKVVCVLNRKGRAQLLVCDVCDTAAECELCGGASRLDDDGRLQCRRCNHSRPVVCMQCQSTKLKQLRVGVARVREELQALTTRDVAEVTGESGGLPDVDILIGTEAVLHRVGRADAVVFLEFDQEMLAARYRAAEDALVLLARASRIVGGRRKGGIVVVQTRVPDNEVLDAAVHGDPMRLFEIEHRRRRELGWPPYRVLARVSGAGATEFVDALPDELTSFGPDERGAWLLQAADRETLSVALTTTPRPRRRTRIEVDPPRI